MNQDQLQALARDLRKTPPRSPREKLGGFVIGARMLDKARADLLGIKVEYNYYPCGLGPPLLELHRHDINGNGDIRPVLDSCHTRWNCFAASKLPCPPEFGERLRSNRSFTTHGS
jgi:Domain of unknown function (DUF5069)